jgi:hypothetical protein
MHTYVFLWGGRTELTGGRREGGREGGREGEVKSGKKGLNI